VGENSGTVRYDNILNQDLFEENEEKHNNFQKLVLRPISNTGTTGCKAHTLVISHSIYPVGRIYFIISLSRILTNIIYVKSVI
jgi:hypothetical protein